MPCARTSARISSAVALFAIEIPRLGSFIICCNLLFGYSLRSKARAKLLVVLPIVISIALMLVADIDTPRHGIVHVSPQNLVSLAESLRAQ